MARRTPLRIESLRFGARPDLDEEGFNNQELPGAPEFAIWCAKEGLVVGRGSVHVDSEATSEDWSGSGLSVRDSSISYCCRCGLKIGHDHREADHREGERIDG